jgi:putative hydrolase of the HAD superfamily
MERPAPIRAVLFDAAGTLIHLREAVGETYARAARACGVETDPEELQAAFARLLRSMPPMVFPGRSRAEIAACERAWWRELVWRVFHRAGEAEGMTGFETCFDGLFAHFATPAAWRCAGGAAALLRQLRARGIATGVVSNFDLRLLGLLDTLGLSPLLDVVILPADAAAAKPDPAIFALALDRLAIRASEAVYVGDDAEEDVAAARRAGMRAIDVTSVSDLAELSWLLHG